MMLTPDQMLTLAARAHELNPHKSRILVVVQLSGGNDGLNTVVPYEMGTYYDARPLISIRQQDVLPLNHQIGFHPNMSALAELFRQGQVAVVQSVGYPDPSRSHFRSNDIWHTAESDQISDTGWLGRYLDLKIESEPKTSSNMLAAVSMDPIAPKTLLSKKAPVSSLNNMYGSFIREKSQCVQVHQNRKTNVFADIYSNLDSNSSYVDFLQEIGLEADDSTDYLLESMRRYKNTVQYPDGRLGIGLKFISQMICLGAHCPVYFVSLDGFDTHASQATTHPFLLKQLSDALSAFHFDLSRNHGGDNVITLVFSEFGRRVTENINGGTDHGTVGPVLLIGNKVKGGIYGDHASLTNVNPSDLKFKIDFRTIYATILDCWFLSDSVQILRKHFDHIAFV